MKRTSALRYDIHHDSTGITLALFGRFAVLETGNPITTVGVRRYRVGPITVSFGRVHPKTPTPLRLAQPTPDPVFGLGLAPAKAPENPVS